MEMKYWCKDKFSKEWPAHSLVLGRRPQPVKSGEAECWRDRVERRLMVLSTSEPCLVSPLVDVRNVNKAYGSAAVPKLLSGMLSRDEVTAYRSINTLLQEMYKPETVVQAVRHNIVSRLVKLMSSEEDLLCMCALSCMRVLSVQPSGKQSILNNRCAVVLLRSLLRDSSPDVRSQAVLTVHTLALNYTGVHTLVSHGFIEVVMELINHAEHPLLVLKELLSLLELLCDDGESARTLAMAHDAFDIVALLYHSDADVRTAAAGVLAQLFHSAVGKAATVDRNLLAVFQEKLRDPDVGFKGKLLTGLMLATTDLEVRKTADKWIVREMLQVLADYDTVSRQVEVSAVKVLTNLAELPHVRNTLKLFVGNLLRLSTADSVRSHVDTLIQTILGTA